MMFRNRENKKLGLPWSGKIEVHNNEALYIIRNNHNDLVVVMPVVNDYTEKFGNFILRAANANGIRDAVYDNVENILIIWGIAIFILTMINVLLDIEYSPMLILSGGTLISAGVMSAIRNNDFVKVGKWLGKLCFWQQSHSSQLSKTQMR